MKKPANRKMPKPTRNVVLRPRNDPTLAKWCIEQAMRWPTLSGFSGGMVYGGLPQHANTDADVIGRAQKIFDWVNGND